MALKEEVVSHTYKELLNKFSLFREAKGEWLQFAWHIFPQLKRVHFKQFEVIYREEDVSD